MPSREALVQGALEAAANGWLVAPIAVNAKAPIRGRHWNQEATNDPNRIRELWADTPYNVAGVTGRYLVIDVDVAGGKQGAESLERLAAEYGHMDTRVHRTPSGGFHYIFECPPDWSLKPAPLHPDFPGIDLKCGVSYIVLPPSEIDGRNYWVEVDIPPSPAPDWIRTLREGPAKMVAHVDGRMHLDALPPGSVGSRDVTLTRLAGKLRRQGHNATNIIAQIAAVNAEWRNPLPMADLIRIATSAERWKPAPLGGLGLGDADTDNARAVLRVSDRNLLFRHEDSRWTVWDGRKWGTDAFRGSYIEETIVLIATLMDESQETAAPGSDLIKQLYKKMLRLKSANGRRGLWQVMADLPGVTQLNEAFDADPCLLNVVNGIVDLRTGTLLPHDKKAMLTKLTGAPYDPAADMKEWEAFILWCCKGDAEQAHWLKVALGQSLIGQQDEQIVLFLYGPGKNGKSVLMEALRTTLGDYGLESSADLLTAKGKDALHTEMIAALQGKRLVICPEPEKGSYWAAARMKSLTGNEHIEARHLYGRQFSFKASHQLVVHGNYQPEVRDLSIGFRRRLRLVPFDNQVTDDMEVRNLGEVLAGPGVLRWLIEGAIEYYRLQALPPCQRVREETERYLGEQDHFARCFTENCERNTESWETVHDLYEIYRWWASQEGLRFVETKQEMVKWLVAHGYRSVRRRKGGSTPQAGYQGLKIFAQYQDSLPA